MMVGGYGLAITVDTLGLSMWLGIPIGLLAAAVLAVVLGGQHTPARPTTSPSPRSPPARSSGW